MQFLIHGKNNNKKYDVRQGLTITQNYNETLDSVEFVISHTTDYIDIEPFDECELISDKEYEGFILDESDNLYHLYMCVDKYNKKRLSVSGSVYYEYQISLFSQTKLLEGIILPSLKITRGKYAKKVLDYLEKYLIDYAPKHRYSRRTIHGFEDTWELNWYFDGELRARFSKIDCPEMQWNNPTLRQVFTDLMMVDDCIPVLRNGVIYFLDVSAQKGQMDTSNVNYIEQSQSSDDYVSELRMDIKNAISEKDKLVEVCEYIGFRNSDVGILNDNNVRLETQHPIYDLVSLKAHCFVGATNFFSQEKRPDGSAKYHKIRLNYVASVDLVKEGICCESSVRQVKPVYALEWNNPIDSYKKMAQYQNLNFYYSRGDNKILGFNDKTKVYFNIVGQGVEQYNFITLEETIALANKKTTYQGVVYETSNTPAPLNRDLTNLYFEIKYRTTADALFQAGKTQNATNNRVVVDNQTNSYVDANAQGVLEYLKANRLGNQMLLMNARYKPDQTHLIAKLGDAYINDIVFRKQLSIFDDYTLVNYYATKNYVLRDYFTGVQAKQRSWKLVSGSDALVRNDLLKIYFQFSYKEGQPEFKDDNVPLYAHNTGLGYLVNSMLFPFSTMDDINEFRMKDYAKLKGSINFIDKNGVIYPNNQDSYYVEVVKRVLGKSLVFTFNLQDSIYVGRGILQKVTGGYAQNPLRYADNNGENIGGYCTLGLYKPTDETIIGFDEATQTNELDIDTGSIMQERFNDEINKKPLITQDQKPQNPAFELSFPFGYDKDNAEITRITLQIEACVRKVDSDYIEIGEEYLKLQPLVGYQLGAVGAILYYSNQKANMNLPVTSQPFMQRNTQGKVSLDYVLEMGLIRGVKFTNCNKGRYTYVVNPATNKIILGLMTVTQPTYTIYVHPYLSRDERIYNEDGTITSIYD